MSPANLSAIELQQQLREIDKKLNQLELQGRHLEDSIRSGKTFIPKILKLFLILCDTPDYCVWLS